MDDFELRLLTKEEVYIDDRDESKTTALKVLQKYRLDTVKTDLVSLTGYLCENGTFYSIQPDFENKIYYYINHYGTLNSESYNVHFPLRLVLKFSNSIVDKGKLEYDSTLGIYKFLFGEYPQYVLNEDNVKEKNIMDALTQKLCAQDLKKTGKTYCFYPSKKDTSSSLKYEVEEYTYGEEKYVPFILRGQMPFTSIATDENIVASYLYWLKVEPITWLYDEDTDLFVAEKAFIPGVGFDFVKEGVGFEATKTYEYINSHLKQDIIPSRIMNSDKSSVLDSSESLKKYVYKQYRKKR